MIPDEALHLIIIWYLLYPARIYQILDGIQEAHLCSAVDPAGHERHIVPAKPK